MRKKTIQEILKFINERSPSFNWPYSFSTPESIACAIAIACGIKEISFLELLQGNVPSGISTEEILNKIPDIQNNSKKEIFLNWIRTTPEAKGSMLAFNSEDLLFLRRSLIKNFDSYESIDIVMLLGFGEKVFPISPILKELLFNYHLIEDSSSYNEIQSSITFSDEGIQNYVKTFLAIKRLDILPHKRKRISIESIYNNIHLKCSNCGEDIHHLKNPVVANITIYPSRNIIFTKKDFEGDLNLEIKKIIEDARKENMEDLEKKVYSEYRLLLCPSCQLKLIRSIENGEIV